MVAQADVDQCQLERTQPELASIQVENAKPFDERTGTGFAGDLSEGQRKLRFWRVGAGMDPKRLTY